MLNGAEDTVLSYIWKQPVLGNAAERDFAFRQLAKQHSAAKMIFTGGSTSNIIPDQEFLKGSLRTFNRDIRDQRNRLSWEFIRFKNDLCGSLLYKNILTWKNQPCPKKSIPALKKPISV